MSKNLDKKLLAEAFDAIVNDNDVAKATRLFKRHWDLAARNSYALLESADEDFEITDMGDDFNNEIADEIGSDAEEGFNQVQLAIDELEDKFPAEMSDEVKAKFDDLRNIVDEMKLAEGDEDEGLAEDAAVALEDIKGEFEMAGDIDDEVSDLFDEISTGLQGDAAAEDEVDVADDDEEEEAAEDLDECGSTEIVEADEGLEADEDAGVDLEFEGEENEEAPLDDEEPKSEDEIKDEIKYTAEDLVALIDELEAADDEPSEEGLEEGWSKIADPRKKLTSEEEGVNKKGTMNFGKLRGMTLDKSAGLGVNHTDSKGTAPSAKHKTENNDNKGAKQWHKVEKPANKPAAGKSMMGKK